MCFPKVGNMHSVSVVVSSHLLVTIDPICITKFNTIYSEEEVKLGLYATTDAQGPRHSSPLLDSI